MHESVSVAKLTRFLVICHFDIATKNASFQLVIVHLPAQTIWKRMKTPFEDLSEFAKCDMDAHSRKERASCKIHNSSKDK